MDGPGNGLGRRDRRADRVLASATLRRVLKSNWFWLGWACLLGALLGLVNLITPGIQFLLLGGAIVAFQLNARSAAASR
jgi:hypothetical protein